MRTTAATRGRRALIAAVLALAGLVATTATTLAQPAPEAAQDAPGRAEPSSGPTAADERRWVAARVNAVRPVPEPSPAETGPRVMAVYDGVELVEPARDPLAIGFHQAGGNHPGLTPVGRVLTNENPRGTGDIDADDDGPEIHVMASRGRGGSGTSAVDVALSAGTPVHAVVTGTVRQVASYSLYGRHHDVLVEIEPEGRPDLRVVLYHLEDVSVAVGDRVVAGVTPVAASARHIPVVNQIDRFAGECPCAHVDIRLRRV